jgi:cytochrome P450
VTPVDNDLKDVLVAEREVWQDGAPNELFAQLRRECPVHWTERMTEFPEQAGFWSVTTAEDVHTVSRDWRTYSSEVGGVTSTNIASCSRRRSSAPPKWNSRAGRVGLNTWNRCSSTS